MDTTQDTTEARPDGSAGQDKLAPVLAMLDQGVTALLDSAEYARYLRVLAKFHRYSSRNVLLILMRRPDATVVNAFCRWKELGRSVRKGEHSIRILAPLRRKVETDGDGDDDGYRIFGFKTVSVFDVSQTDGEPLDGAQRVAGGDAGVEVDEGEHAQRRIAATAHRVLLSPRRVARRPPPGPHGRTLRHGLICSWGT